eukprot:5128020-Pyramimonas_sp.AAC.1
MGRLVLHEGQHSASQAPRASGPAGKIYAAGMIARSRKQEIEHSHEHASIRAQSCETTPGETQARTRVRRTSLQHVV